MSGRPQESTLWRGLTAGRDLAILLSEAFGVGSLSLGRDDAVVEDMLHFLPKLHCGVAIEPDFAIEGENSARLRSVDCAWMIARGYKTYDTCY